MANNRELKFWMYPSTYVILVFKRQCFSFRYSAKSGDTNMWWENTQNHSFVICRWKLKAVSSYMVLWFTGIVGISMAFHGSPCNFGKFGSRRLCCINFSQFQTQTLGFLIVGKFLIFILILRTVDSQTLQTLLRVLSTLYFSGLNFGKVSTVMIFSSPLILKLLYSASAVEHYKLLSYDLCFPLSCRYFRFKNSPVEMKLS